jgi:hypothetical protein
LSGLGLAVVGVDLASDRIAVARQRARMQGAEAEFTVGRVAVGAFPAGPWAGICVFHFLDRELFPAIAAAVAPGGWLVYKTHLAHPGRAPDRRPRNPAYLLRPGELLRAFPVLIPEHYAEWLEAGNGYAALLARRPGPSYSS